MSEQSVSERSGSVADRVHHEIMNLPEEEHHGEVYSRIGQAYAAGHRDARHAAAELALQAITAALTAKDRRIEELEKSVADYAANLGDIVTYGTTADVLDQHLQAAVKELTAMTAERDELDRQRLEAQNAQENWQVIERAANDANWAEFVSPQVFMVLERIKSKCGRLLLRECADKSQVIVDLYAKLTAVEAERDGLREEIAEKYCCKIEANQRIAAAQEEAAAMFRPELEDARKERDVRGQILDEIKDATGSTWWHGAIDWANRVFAAIHKADSTPNYQSKVTRELVPAFIRQLAKERDHANRMYQTAAELGAEFQKERDALRAELSALRAAAEGARGADGERAKPPKFEFETLVLGIESKGAGE